MDGLGTFTWSNGDKYIGAWEDNKMHGGGTKTWSNGDKYVGIWKDNEMHGTGTLYNSADVILRKGTFREGKYIGK